jgi:1-acyl-sn-glycerol-3-phosphate acyltransferase
MHGLLRFLEELSRTLVGVLVLPPLLLMISLGALLQRLVGMSASQMNWTYYIFSRAFIAISGARMMVYGRQHLQPGRVYVVVANHESNLDPFAMMDGIRELSIRFVLKRQLAQIPIFGHALSISGNATVQRQGGARGSDDVRRIRQAVSTRDPRVSLLVFAEGTRSRDGGLKPFKKGAFATAIEAGLPVLPVGLAGTYRILQPGKTWVRSGGGIALEIGPPIEVTAQTSREALHAETFAIVAKLRAQARARLREAGIDPGGRDE